VQDADRLFDVRAGQRAGKTVPAMFSPYRPYGPFNPGSQGYSRSCPARSPASGVASRPRRVPVTHPAAWLGPSRKRTYYEGT
jgi:hypothetical protein